MTAIPTSTLEPIKADERIEALDILRGFALFGILLTNITRFFDRAPYASGADTTVTWIIDHLVDWHFFPLFSFLFGVGFAIQLARAQAKNAPFLKIYLRRVGVLFLLGVAFFVIVEGERILYQYALLGAVLLLFRNRSPRALLAWAVAFLVIAAEIAPALDSAIARVEGLVPAAQAQGEAAKERALHNWDTQVLMEEAKITGDYRQLVTGRLRILSLPALQLPLSSITFAMFLLGMYAYRRRVFEDLAGNRRLVRRTLYWGLGVHVTLSPWVLRPLLRDVLGVRSMAATHLPIWPFWDVALTFAYMAGVVLLLRWGIARRLLTLLGWTGRMSLTVYVLHYVLVTTIFYGYGLGLNEVFGQAMSPVFTVLVTLIPIPLSIWWLRRYRFGPLEWVWRSLTYGKRQPMRIEPAARSRARVPYLRGVVAAIGVITVWVTLASRESADRRHDDQAAIARLEREWRSALLGADTAALGGIVTPDYRVGGIGGERTSRARLMEAISSRTLNYASIVPDSAFVVAHKRTGSASGLETQVVSSHGASVGGERRYVNLYVKREGRWWLYGSYVARAS